MKRLIAIVTMCAILVTGVYAGGGVQYLQEHHEEQKIKVLHMRSSYKMEDIVVPEGWHVVDVVMANHSDGDITIVIVLERNHR